MLRCDCADSLVQYCEFGGTKAKCEEWLQKAHPKLHAKIYSDGTRLQQRLDIGGSNSVLRRCDCCQPFYFVS